MWLAQRGKQFKWFEPICQCEKVEGLFDSDTWEHQWQAFKTK